MTAPRPWMPWYVGDYLRDTAHLGTEEHGAYCLLLMHCWVHGRIPEADTGRAAVAKMSPARWKRSKSTLNAFFQVDGTHKRVSKEIAKADEVVTKRRIAASKGGTNSAIARAKGRPLPQAFGAAYGAPQAQQKPSSSSSTAPHIHNHIAISSLDVPVSNGEKKEEGSRSLATARVDGALTSVTEGAAPPKPTVKPVTQLTKVELDAHYAARRTAKGAA